MYEHNLQKRGLGKTGLKVSIIGLGGNRLFKKPSVSRQAKDTIYYALQNGINFFDTARLYPNSEDYFGHALRGQRSRVILSTKTHARDAISARSHLYDSLRALNTDYIDIWQLHDIREKAEIDLIFGPGGAIETLVWAKKEGLVRYIGITAHRNPHIMRMAIERFPFDTVMMPVNPAEDFYQPFLTEILPVALRNNMGIIAIYIYWGGKVKQLLSKLQTVEPLQRFALTQNVSTALVGVDDLNQLKDNIKYAARYTAMTDNDAEAITDLVQARYEELMYYKFN